MRINEELKNIGRSLTDICQVEERLGQVGSPQLEEASQLMGKVSGLLRADVSILIPSHVGRAEPSVSLQARNIVNEADCPRLVVDETMETVAKLVYKLLSVETCALCRPGSDKMDIDPDIMSMVATMCGDYSNMDDDTDSENRWVLCVCVSSASHLTLILVDLPSTTRLERRYWRSPGSESRTVLRNFKPHSYLTLLGAYFRATIRNLSLQPRKSENRRRRRKTGKSGAPGRFCFCWRRRRKVLNLTAFINLSCGGKL